MNNNSSYVSSSQSWVREISQESVSPLVRDSTGNDILLCVDDCVNRITSARWFGIWIQNFFNTSEFQDIAFS